MFLFCLVFAMPLCASIYMCFVVTCWERADLLALVCGYLIVSIPDLCTLTYFVIKYVMEKRQLIALF